MTPRRPRARLLVLLAAASCAPEAPPQNRSFDLDLRTPQLSFRSDVGHCIEQPLRFRNTGTATGRVVFQAPTWDCEDPGVFRIGEGALTLPPAAKAEVAVRYCPSADGSCLATLPLVWTGTGPRSGTLAVALEGVGISPDEDQDGYTLSDGDCDDGDPTVFPGAPEAPNDRDDDCDGTIDENTVAHDDDGDGLTEEDGDCDDADPTRRPGLPEQVDGIDQNCDGRIDDGTVVYDDDGDGYAEDEGDCADTNPDRHPGRPEVADGIDQDCDGTVDENTPAHDDDGDGITEDAGDCDDANPAVHPGAPEAADGIDSNCNGVIDENTSAHDDDGDGYAEVDGDCNDGNPAVVPGAPELPNGMDDDCDGTVDEGTIAHDDDGDGMTEEAGDCDDGDPSVLPGATETPDGVDEDCDGIVDEGTTAFDDDGDGLSEDDGDCDDSDEEIWPGHPEDQTNGIDDDCDGSLDEVDPIGGLDEMTTADLAHVAATFAFSSSAHGITDLLDEIDWRSVDGESYVSSIKDQGLCGSCVLFAGLAAAESALAIQSGVASSVDLSEAWTSACQSSLDYCGNTLSDLSDGLIADGVVEESVLPYADDCSYATGSCTDASALSCTGSPDHSFADAHYIAAGDTDETKAALHLGPVMVSMRAYSDLGTADESTAYQPAASAQSVGLHAVTLVGYDNTGWLVKNSWSTRAHDDGYFRIAFGASEILREGAWLFEADGGDLSAGLNLLDYGNLADLADLPNGTVCGLTHSRNGGALCEGHDAQTSCPAGMTQRYGGDHNMGTGQGFYWCEVTAGTDSPDLDDLPDGLVCGLQHKTNGPTAADCMGHDTTTGSCPTGWTAMYGGDDGASSSGDGFYWCELTAGCEDASCLQTGQSGLTCGLGYDTESHGRCLSVSPVESASCPTATTYALLGDMGRDPGDGYAACATDG